jgi:hypothetical protein
LSTRRAGLAGCRSRQGAGESSRAHAAEHAEAPRDGRGLNSINAGTDDWAAASEAPKWGFKREIEQRKALIAYKFVRDIRNGNPPAEAARLLFDQHHAGPGSGWLGDYVDDLPRTSEHGSSISAYIESVLLARLVEAGLVE